jgi:IS30 family transposase
MRVSHETIYLSLFVQSRSALRRKLHRCLRTGRAMRYPRGKRLPQGRGQLRDTLPISQRPPEAADRAVPGHWEGDLVLGKRPSAVGTLVERHSRYVVLFPLPEGFTAQRMRPALTAAVLQLPQQLRRSLTWDHGKEMAEHLQFTIDSGVQVYFCDPRSPWQRASNENTTAWCANTSPRVATSASSTRPRWTPSPPSSTAALDRRSVSGHPHRHWRRRCADPLRPPPILRCLDWW